MESIRLIFTNEDRDIKIMIHFYEFIFAYCIDIS